MISSSCSGQLFVVSAPSGVGKTTIIQSVLPHWPSLFYSVSCTTRPPRPGEVSGKDYHFLSKEEFLSGIRAGRFLEWAQVHGHYYGTDGEQIEERLRSGYNVLMDIDVQGARQVLCACPYAHTIFILPPSLEVLRERLEKRGTESPEQLAGRLAAAQGEIKEAPWYEFVIVNDVLDTAIADFHAILRASGCLRSAQAWRVRSFLLPRASD